MTYRENRNNPEGNRRVDDLARRCYGGVVDCFTLDKGCEVLDEELTHE